MLDDGDRVAVLAHETFPERAKTAVGILRYADYEAAAVLDRTGAGTRVADHVPDVPDAPVVASMADAPTVDALVVGVAPIGGGFDESWRPDVRVALERGCDVASGLHHFLRDDDEFAALADEHGADIWDVRRPPADLTVSEGVARDVDADVVLTVGTDCSTGKMTTSMELVGAARDRGIDAAMVPTGQTGIMIEGWGTPIDRVVSDFVAGAAEDLVVRGAADHDLLVVEGQGSIVHPAYSAVTCGLLHGTMPDRLVLCHVAGREAVHGYEEYALPPVESCVDRYESLAAPVNETRVVAGSLNTAALDGDVAAREAVDAYADAVGAPATDPIRFDAAEVVGSLC
jgi:uncharacterized NAD-dependent epimerase/dehydratase family protein